MNILSRSDYHENYNKSSQGDNAEVTTKFFAIIIALVFPVPGVDSMEGSQEPHDNYVSPNSVRRAAVGRKNRSNNLYDQKLSKHKESRSLFFN